MVFSATFNNISFLVMGETGVPGENVQTDSLSKIINFELNDF